MDAALALSPSASEPRRAGRPTKYTPATLEKLLTAISQGVKITTAVKLAGIGYETYREWLHASDAGDPAYAGFSAQVQMAEAAGEQELIQIVRDATKIDWHAAAWGLARLYGYEAKVGIAVQHSGTVAHTHVALVAPDLPAILTLLAGQGALAPPLLDQAPQSAAGDAE